MKRCELVIHNDTCCGKEATIKVLWTKDGHDWSRPIETYLCATHIRKFRNSLDHLGCYETEEFQIIQKERVSFT